jgi:hypothetical protein
MMLDPFIDFGMMAVKQLTPLVAWVFIWAAIYAALERVFPRLGGPPATPIETIVLQKVGD